ncbi:response regulator [Acetobacter sp.]|jgi:two-component system KDP operon response regulator KdpE|uniref:response regulator n=1 Tax=Acetobacter sp. TaxID=440 RepID=UPI0025BD682F|nr:response regulator transcription factor [Acetobacter sp.]MCH4091151.1 response regulator transcription factor [Acetobacter sp.]MCI1301255.1 response regulator transcription factor [Acetobacter sp.]MCI1317563.1 response regulator transcription factor [Acetobacter sp.]
MSAPRVLVVDDEPAIRRLLRTSLATQDWRVIEAGNGMNALAAVKAEEIDVVLLDLGLPDMDGIEVIRQMRLALPTLPIVVLSVRDDERGKVAALDLGADDYVTKPFGMAELVARLRAALRHALQKEGTIPLYVSGDLSVDLVRRIVTRSGKEVHLSPREWDILRLLIRHAGRVLTHKHILGQLWGANGDVQQLRVYIRQIRQKLEENPERPTYIITETGIGYRLIDPMNL